MTPTPLQELLARFERERLEADQQYNSALTALDAATQRMPGLPQPPQAYDTTKLPELNTAWDIGADAPAADRSLKGRLRGLVWALVGPPLQKQRQFNAALVDHLNRNAGAHQESRDVADATITVLRDHIEALLRFQSHLIAYLQKVTLYVDTSGKARELYTETLLPAVAEGLAKVGRNPGSIEYMIEMKVSFDPDRARALEDTRNWAALALSPEEKTGVEDPVEMEKLADALPTLRAASRWIVSSHPDEHVERLAETIDLGFTHLVFHAPGPDQRRFLDLYAEQVLPRLRARYGGAG